MSDGLSTEVVDHVTSLSSDDLPSPKESLQPGNWQEKYVTGNVKRDWS